MNNQPIVFNIQYTPYKPRAGATQTEIERHKEEREFYDMTGTKNLYDYMTTEEKIADKFNVLDYFQKTTGVFNGQGFISAEQVCEMRGRLRNNKGNIFHGFISFNEEESSKIDTPEKCIAFIKATFGKFLEEAHFSKKNIDLEYRCECGEDKTEKIKVEFISENGVAAVFAPDENGSIDYSALEGAYTVIATNEYGEAVLIYDVNLKANEQIPSDEPENPEQPENPDDSEETQENGWTGTEDPFLSEPSVTADDGAVDSDLQEEDGKYSIKAVLIVLTVIIGAGVVVTLIIMKKKNKKSKK